MTTSYEVKPASKRKINRTTRRPPYIIYGFDLRRPFDALWGLFGSVRTAVVLISALVLLSLIGALIMQAPMEVLDSPADYNAWVAASAQPMYGVWTDLFNRLQFFTLFHSWYFKTVIAVLAINILIGGLLNRVSAIWAKYRHQPLKRADNFYANSPVKAGFIVTIDSAGSAQTAEGMQSFFRKRGFRVQKAPESNDETIYLYAHKFDWSILFTFLFHTCLIAIMFSAVITGWSGFGPNSTAQKTLPAPVFSFLQNLAGFSYDQPMPDGSQGVVYPLGTPHNIYYRVKDFTVTFDPKLKSPTDFYTDLEVYQDGKLVKSGRIRVNTPLAYEGITFHQASFIMYTSIIIRDAQGQVIYNGAIPLIEHGTTPDPNTGNALQTNDAINVPIANYGETMNVAATNINGVWVVGVKGFDQQNTELFTGAMEYGRGCVGAGTSVTALQQYGCQMSNNWWLQVNTVKLGTVLLVTKDAGSTLLWPTFLLLTFSLYILFALPPQRIWMRIRGRQVEMASLKERTINMQRILNDCMRRIRCKPLVYPAVSASAAVETAESKELLEPIAQS